MRSQSWHWLLALILVVGVAIPISRLRRPRVGRAHRSHATASQPVAADMAAHAGHSRVPVRTATAPQRAASATVPSLIYGPPTPPKRSVPKPPAVDPAVLARERSLLDRFIARTANKPHPALPLAMPVKPLSPTRTAPVAAPRRAVATMPAASLKALHRMTIPLEAGPESSTAKPPAPGLAAAAPLRPTGGPAASAAALTAQAAQAASAPAPPRGIPYAEALGLPPTPNPSTANSSPEGIIYVLDSSSAMSDGGRTAKAVAEVERALAELKPGDRFGVIAFDAQIHPMSPTLVPATRQNVDRAVTFLEALKPGGQPDLEAALASALSRSDATHVVLITAGEPANPSVALDAIRKQQHPPRIMVVSLGGDEPKSIDLLKRLAEATGGAYGRVSR